MTNPTATAEELATLSDNDLAELVSDAYASPAGYAPFYTGRGTTGIVRATVSALMDETEVREFTAAIDTAEEVAATPAELELKTIGRIGHIAGKDAYTEKWCYKFGRLNGETVKFLGTHRSNGYYFTQYRTGRNGSEGKSLTENTYIRIYVDQEAAEQLYKADQEAAKEATREYFANMKAENDAKNS